jgi:hypothetical protein
MSKLSRRGFLTGLGGLAIALPWLERFSRPASAAPAPNGPKRIIVMTYLMGVPGGAWKPSTTGTGFTLPYVTAPLQPWRDRCLFVSDIDNSVLEEGGNSFAFGHPAKSEACLTGTLTSNAFPTTNTNNVTQVIGSASAIDGARANAASVEHVIGQQLYSGQAFRSIDLGVDGDIVRGATPGTHTSRFFFEGRDTPISIQADPRRAFERYFAMVPTGGGPSPALLELRARNKSVLDAVRESYGDTARGLGTDDRRRLEEHASRIRQIEIGGATPSCAQPTNITSGAGERMNNLAAMQIRMLAQAMACDLAPVGRLEFLNQQSPRFGLTTLDNTLESAQNYDWHAMVHGDPLPGTSTGLRPGVAGANSYDQRLQDGYRFFVQQFANLMAELDKFPEGNGTVLDNTMLVLASDLGEGLGHHHGKMGFIVAGKTVGGRTNTHVRCTTADGFYTTSSFEVVQLLNSLCDMAGVTSNGQPVSVGLQGYLSKVGRPRRIDGLFA